MAHGTRVSGAQKSVTAGFTRVGGVQKKIIKGLTRVSGVQKDINFLSGEPVGNLTIGASVYIPVSGVLKEFIVVHQGKPSSLYDDSCDGTWLMMKDIDSQSQWHSGNTIKYSGSKIQTYLNDSFLSKIDTGVVEIIKTVKIPYVSGSITQYGVTKPAVSSGSNGLSCKSFALSVYELNWTTSTSNKFPVDGACLSYFSGTLWEDSKRIAYLNGNAAFWWLRSLTIDGSVGKPVAVSDTGRYQILALRDTHGVRPAFILPANATVDENFQLIA